MALRISQTLLDQIFKQALDGKPYEICGVGGGVGDGVLKIYPTDNEKKSEVAYVVDGKQLLRAMKDIDSQKWDMNLIYHSHPATVAYPSQTDISLAYYPDSYYMIVSLKSGVPEPRVFKIKDNQVSEQQIEISQ
jgi:proteasome lid subunit RPN8/RPN11